MHLRSTAALVAALAGLGLASVAWAAPDAEAERIDLARLYPTPQAEVDARPELAATAARLGALRGQVVASPDSLLQALRLRDELQVAAHRHAIYLRLRCKMDRAQRAACADEAQIEAQADAASDLIGAELRAAPAKRLHDLATADPKLAPYAYAIDELRRTANQGEAAAAGEALDTFSPEIIGWQGDLYDELIGSIDFGQVQTAQGPLDVARQRSLIMTSPDRQVRLQGYRLRARALASRRDLFAFTLLRLAQAGNKLAARRGFATAADQSYFDRRLEPGQVRALIEDAAAHGDLAKRFQSLRASEVKGRLGVADPASYDQLAPTAVQPSFTLAEARAALHDAFARLGPWYQGQFDALLDPRNGRADIVVGGAPGRSGGGFSQGYPGTTSLLFVQTFNGTFKDLSVIAHEGGHAVHRQAMANHGVLPDYAQGQSWLMEAVAEFNELVLADHMAAVAKDPAQRRWYEEMFLAIKGLDWLYGAQDALLEQSVYDGVKAGRLHGADDLDALTVQVLDRFSLYAHEPEQKLGWITTPLMYEDPNYDVNYAYASALALRCFAMFKADPKAFAPRWRAFLEGGFDAPPDVLLRRSLGIELDGHALVAGAAAAVEARLKRLEAETAPANSPSALAADGVQDVTHPAGELVEGEGF